MKTEKISTKAPQEIHAVNYAGYIKIQDGPYYDDTDLLDEDKNAMAEAFSVELVRRWKSFPDLEKANAELLEALKPFEALAQEVLSEVHRPNLNRTLYAFNKTEITYDDLRKAIAAIQKHKPQ